MCLSTNIFYGFGMQPYLQRSHYAYECMQVNGAARLLSHPSDHRLRARSIAAAMVADTPANASDASAPQRE